MELILEVCPQTPYKSHLIADHQFMKKKWRKRMGKEADFLFNVPIVKLF